MVPLQTVRVHQTLNMLIVWVDYGVHQYITAEGFAIHHENHKIIVILLATFIFISHSQ
jgi:hypothetical protein